MLCQGFTHDQSYLLSLIRHIYHYYIHGPRGNDKPVGRGTTASPFRNIDIQVSLNLMSYFQTFPPSAVGCSLNWWCAFL